ncbi:chitin synthase [Pyrenophora seminiperda CCB06]|uniref:chitin synthase n=1 Tax=Pyrenophora seminiperda CCB06 TaxID=1302712 RepID=A0A3M7M440_9PLEO|nr:chitin synthase [Pyrenophora seminiperda CCB06]
MPSNPSADKISHDPSADIISPAPSADPPSNFFADSQDRYNAWNTTQTTLNERRHDESRPMSSYTVPSGYASTIATQIDHPEYYPPKMNYNRNSGNSCDTKYTTSSEDQKEKDYNEKDYSQDYQKEKDYSHDWPELPEIKDPARHLTGWELGSQRFFFAFTILAINVAIALMAIFAHPGLFVLIFMIFVKSKDVLSVLMIAGSKMYHFVKNRIYPKPEVSRKWILSLIPTYSESEEQIIKAIKALRHNDVDPHIQVMCVILDGKHRDILTHMTRVVKTWKRPYVTTKSKTITLQLYAGFIDDVPIIVAEKLTNAGKKDSLVMCHDLFNSPRENMPVYTQRLREEIWAEVLPQLTAGHDDFTGFDMVFCTDADSTVCQGAVAKLANAISNEPDAIAACGLVLVELEPGYEWSIWNLYQQYQYTYGQFVRRMAEGTIGKVTCLPGCITMIAVRPEMAGAITKYASPVTGLPVIHHQVQYLGTDRRLTYSMLSQGKKMRTIFVPDAVSETVAPQSLLHYLSQRRRWGSNAYFNNYFYCFGNNMWIITRIAAAMELVRMTMIYYRVVNTILFIKGLVEVFNIFDVLPLLIITQLPLLWFIFSTIFLEPELRKRGHKLFLGFFLNKLFSPFISITVFTRVIKNLGSQVWGVSGVTASQPPVVAAPVDLEAQKPKEG